MIYISRHGVRALNASLTSTCLHVVPQAESSRSALLRATLLQKSSESALMSSRSKGKLPDSSQRAYSTAATKAKQEEDNDTDFLDEVRSEPAERSNVPLYHSRRTRDRDDHASPSIDDLSRHIPKSMDAPIPHRPRIAQVPVAAEMNPLNMREEAKEGKTEEQLSLKTLSKQLKKNPISAFLAFHTISDEALSSFGSVHFDRLFAAMDRTREKGQYRLRAIARSDAEVVLVRIRTQLTSLPPRQRDVDTPQRPGTPQCRLRGRRLFNFLTLCVWLNCTSVARETFTQLVPQQNFLALRHEGLLEGYALSLAQTGKYDLLIDSFTNLLFPTDLPNVPISDWTPHLLAIIAQAFLVTDNPLSVVRIVHDFQAGGGQLTGPIHQHFLQALVQLGHHDEAQAARDLARQSGFDSQSHRIAELIAILRGQRALGFDPDLEERVLKDLRTFPPDNAAQILHHLIRLRLDVDDYEGAKRLFGMFDIRIWNIPKTTLSLIPPIQSTYPLAFRFITLRPDADKLQSWWSLILSRPVYLKDSLIASLVRALASLDKVDDAYRMVRTHVLGLDPEGFAWKLPAMSQVSVRTLNTLIRYMAKAQGIVGLERATDLMREADVSPDNETLVCVVDAVRKNMSVQPLEIALLVQSLLARSRDVKAQIGLVDAILAEAVKSIDRSHKLVLSRTDRSDLRDPTAGLVPIGDFGSALDTVLDNLRARGVQSRSSSMQSRLQFEAALGTKEAGIPAAQNVCNQLTEMGYRINKKHLTALLRGYVVSGSIDQARQIPRLARSMRIKLDKEMWMLLLEGWAKAGRLQLAKKAYESIRSLGRRTPKEGLDLIAITSMIQCLSKAKQHHAAVRVVHKDLLRSGIALDDVAIKIAMKGLIDAGNPIAALKLFDRRPDLESAIDHKYQDILKSCRQKLRHKAEEGRAQERDIVAIDHIQQIIDGARPLRPYLDPLSAFSHPPDDPPRIRFVNGKRVSGSLAPGKQRLVVPREGSIIRNLLMSGNLAEDEKEVQEAAKEHRAKLEQEIRARRAGTWDGHRRRSRDRPGDQVEEEAVASQPHVFTAQELKLIDGDVQRYTLLLRAYGVEDTKAYRARRRQQMLRVRWRDQPKRHARPSIVAWRKKRAEQAALRRAEIAERASKPLGIHRERRTKTGDEAGDGSFFHQAGTASSQS